MKNWIARGINALIRTKSLTYRKYISKKVHESAQLNTQRNKIITYDFIMESETSPQDGFELFRYIYAQKNSPYEVYYIMNADSPQYAEIKETYGDAIVQYSWDGRKVFAKWLIEAMKTIKIFTGGFQVLHSLQFGITEAVKESPYVYSLFTQHGVNFFKDLFITPRTYSAFLFDKIMVSNDFEKELFMRQCGYEEKDIVKNGLFRWDLLSPEHVASEKSIFIFFTHRRYLNDIEEIQETVYVKTILNLLQHLQLNQLIRENGYTIKLAIHHTVVAKCGADIFTGFQIIEDSEIAEAKRTASILITDYSSMCFEMWFQKKPVIFLNIHDSEDCLKYCHATDLADPYGSKIDYICNVTNSPEECIDLLEHYFATNFQISDLELEKSNFFFYYHSDFCKRYYEQLLEMQHATKDLYRLPLNERIYFAHNANMQVKGIQLPSKGGRFIVAKKASVGFYVPETSAETLLIKLRCKPYLRYKQYRLKVKIYANGNFVYKTSIYTTHNRGFIFESPTSWLTADRFLELSFKIYHARKYMHLKTHGMDRRYLSLKLITVDILERDPSITIEEQIEAKELQYKEERMQFKEAMDANEANNAADANEDQLA